MKTRWLIPLGGLLALGGYFGPWVNHRAGGVGRHGIGSGRICKVFTGGARWTIGALARRVLFAIGRGEPGF